MLPTEEDFLDSGHRDRFRAFLENWPNFRPQPDVVSALFVLTALPSLWAAAEPHIQYSAYADLLWDQRATQASASHLSAGEHVLLDVARDLFNGGGPGFRVRDLDRLDGRAWEIAFTALFLRRGPAHPRGAAS